MTSSICFQCDVTVTLYQGFTEPLLKIKIKNHVYLSETKYTESMIERRTEET